MQHLRDLKQYVTDLNSIPRLSPEELSHLTSCLAAVRQGTLPSEQAAQAKQRLIEGHLWLAVALVKHSGVHLRALSPLDLVQQGNLGLLRACDRFDFASGGNFAAYASKTVRYALLDALPMEDTIKVSYDRFWRNRTDERIEELRALQPLSLDALHGEEDCSVEDLLAAPSVVLPEPTSEGVAEEEERQQTKRAQVAALLAQLTPREQQVLRLRYGLDEADGRCHSASAIARQLGVDCSTVCSLEQRALQKLRTLADPQTSRGPASFCAQEAQAGRRQAQTERLETACIELRAHSIPINVRTLAQRSHVDKAVIRPFVRAYWNQQASEQERLEAASAELEAEGLPVTVPRLCSRAHVGSRAAVAFLHHYHPVARPKPPAARKAEPDRPAKASAQERLSEVYTRLLAQGEKITRARLRKEARVGTDAAGAFLRAQRTNATPRTRRQSKRENGQSN